MEITDVDQFLKYYKRIRSRTTRTINEIPKDKLNWKPHPSAFSFADIIRHIAGIEYNLYARSTIGKSNTYPGHQSDLAMGFDEVKSYFDTNHQKAIDIFSKLTPEDLNSKCDTPAGVRITVWKWLRALVEHEVHHRGQLYTYLRLIEAESTPLYGLTSEEVKKHSEKYSG